MKKLGITLLVFIFLGLIAAAAWYLHITHLAVLDPAGFVAQKERDLIVLFTGLSMLIIIPVFALTAFIAWRYREGNTKAKHNPDWAYKPIVDVIWWTIPTLLIVALSVITWYSTLELDPYKPIPSSAKPLVIQVVSLDWKWLFIYPEQGIATVNEIVFPEKTPVRFEITSDSPMNSFWIPELGSQIYSMPGMTNWLDLIATSTGVYDGWSANLSGSGFAGMMFRAESTTTADFNAWVNTAKQSPNKLDPAAYNALAEPSSYNPVSYYSTTTPNLYYDILAKDMSGAKELSANK